MKIAYIYDVIYPYVIGGAQKRVWELASRLNKKGHEVTIFGMKYWEGEDIIYKDGVRLWGVCPPQELYVDGHRSIKEAIYFASKLLAPLLKERFDVIDCQQFPYFPCFTSKFASLIKKSHFVITWYESWGNYWYEYLGSTKGFAGRMIELFVTKLAGQFIAISDRIKKDLNTLGVDENKIKVVLNGVDFYNIQKTRCSTERFDIIYVGRLAKHKNVDVLAKAVGIIKGNYPEVKCGIIGDGPEKESLLSLTSELCIDGNMKFLGFLPHDEDVISYMKSSKVFVLPSIREGLPNTILEAGACGIPSIIIDHKKNAAVDIVLDGENGFKVELSEKLVADIILKVLENQELRTRMSKASSNYAKKCDWSIVVDELEKVYRDL